MLKNKRLYIIRWERTEVQRKQKRYYLRDLLSLQNYFIL